MELIVVEDTVNKLGQIPERPFGSCKAWAQWKVSLTPLNIWLYSAVFWIGHGPVFIMAHRCSSVHIG